MMFRFLFLFSQFIRYIPVLLHGSGFLVYWPISGNECSFFFVTTGKCFLWISSWHRDFHGSKAFAGDLLCWAASAEVKDAGFSKHLTIFGAGIFKAGVQAFLYQVRILFCPVKSIGILAGDSSYRLCNISGMAALFPALVTDYGALVSIAALFGIPVMCSGGIYDLWLARWMAWHFW